jgi:hypothetical protein
MYLSDPVGDIPQMSYKLSVLNSTVYSWLLFRLWAVRSAAVGPTFVIKSRFPFDSFPLVSRSGQGLHSANDSLRESSCLGRNDRSTEATGNAVLQTSRHNTPVILSGVTASQREAVPQSKDLCTSGTGETAARRCQDAVCTGEFPKLRGSDANCMGPSTTYDVSRAKDRTSLRMTQLRST